MTVYLMVSFVMFLFLGIIWSKAGGSNLLIKFILIALTIWSFLLILKDTDLISFITQGV